MKKDNYDKVNKDGVLSVCNFINNILNVYTNSFRPYEVKQLFEAKQILTRFAFKNFPHEDI